MKEYAGMVSKTSNSNKVLRLWFDRNLYTSPVMRSLAVFSFDDNSDAGGINYLFKLDNRLVGVAPEIAARQVPNEMTGAHVASGKALEAHV